MMELLYKKVFTLFCVTFVVIGIVHSKPWEPTPKNDPEWLERFQANLETSRARGSEIKIVFTGSSSVDYWRTYGKEIWDAKYAPLGAVNYGIGGDRTQHTLWRIENGEFDGISPKLVVIYVGGNNLPIDPEEDVLRGVHAVIDKVHEKVPNANILYVGFFPSGQRSPVKETLIQKRRLIDILQPEIDGDQEKNSHFFDLFWKLAPPSLDGIYEEYYRSDKLHFNQEGYKLWDREMNRTFYELIR